MGWKKIVLFGFVFVSVGIQAHGTADNKTNVVNAVVTVSKSPRNHDPLARKINQGLIDLERIVQASDRETLLQPNSKYLALEQQLRAQIDELSDLEGSLSFLSRLAKIRSDALPEDCNLWALEQTLLSSLKINGKPVYFRHNLSVQHIKSPGLQNALHKTANFFQGASYKVINFTIVDKHKRASFDISCTAYDSGRESLRGALKCSPVAEGSPDSIILEPELLSLEKHLFGGCL